MKKEMPIVKFEDWLLTPQGKRCIDSRILIAPLKDREYLKNQLWWAFNAGQKSNDMQFSECGHLIRWAYQRFGKEMSHSMRCSFEILLDKYKDVK